MKKDNEEIAEYRLKRGEDVNRVILKVDKDKQEKFRKKHNISDEDAE